MSKFRLAVMSGAAINLVMVLLFPPFDSYPIGRGMATFDAFYPLFAAPPAGAVNTGLLYIEIIAVSFNAALAWLMLQAAPGLRPGMRWQGVLQWLVIADLMLILLFPPFEARSLSSFGVNSFDGFRFALTGGIQGGIFLPLLFLELLALAVNAAIFWLAFGMISRGEDNGARTQATAGSAPATRSARQGSAAAGQFGRAKRERRVNQNPGYSGPERRHNKDRRHSGPA